jgi:hypothetical protein
VKFDATIVRAIACLLISSVAISANASDKKNQAKSAPTQKVDSGSFGIFIKGQRVATETFDIQQENNTSFIKSQMKEVAGSDPVTQKSDLQITSSGELIRYDWNQSSGGSLTVLPNNEFLIEKITTPSSSKPAEQPFLMPNTSVILDNNFFIHREVLAWRYLATNCKPENGSMKCKQEPGEFGVLVPQDRTSVRVRLELVGEEKVTIHGTERSLLRLNLKSDDFEWALWVDDRDQFKLMRVAIAADNTEVVRD